MRSKGYPLDRLKGAPDTPGKRLLAEHLSGGTLTRTKAMRAKCCDCMGYHRDGRMDCRLPACPLYPWMPYRRTSKMGA